MISCTINPPSVNAQREICRPRRRLTSRLLPRSPSPSLWLCLACSTSLPLPFLVPTPFLESCFELLYQLSRPFQFRSTHPSRVPVYPVVHNTIDCSLADDVADFPRIIGLRIFDVRGLVRGLVRDGDTGVGVGRFVTDRGSQASIVVTFSDTFSVTIIAAPQVWLLDCCYYRCRGLSLIGPIDTALYSGYLVHARELT
jgi:hypothetical protein